MYRPFQLKGIATRLAAVAAALALAAAPASAQSEAFKISGAGISTNGLPLPAEAPRAHWIAGNATHLGKHTGAGSVQTDWALPVFEDGQLVGFAGEFGSAAPFVFTGANGDKLATYYGRDDLAPPGSNAGTPGTFTLTIVDFTPDMQPVVVAQWLADFVVQPELCTGKFAGVTGSWVMYAWSEPFVLGSSDPLAYAWEGKGRLTFPKK